MGTGNRFPKKRVALMMGYCGSGYQGMQLTIESELWGAVVACDLVSDENSADPKKVGWMRSCRTDKGVHAAGQVVSFKMLCREALSQEFLLRVAEKLNSSLPGQIRIFGIKPVTGGFHAKDRTDSRYYEYLLPTYVFLSADPAPYKTKGTAKQVQEPDGIISLTSEQVGILQSHAMSEQTLEKLRALLHLYVGNHSFHNFTLGKPFGDQSARRSIYSATASEPFRRDDIEWISILFHGQSFMLHQIRKMVGLAIMVLRLGARTEVLPRSFEEARINVPRAPALGLLLDKAVFGLYNERFPDHPAIDFDELFEQRQKLKTQLIYPEIFSEESKCRRFWAWLKANDDHAAEFSYFFP